MGKAAGGLRKRCNFRENDVKRAARALESAGLTVSRIELQEGKVIFFPASKDGSEEAPR